MPTSTAAISVSPSAFSVVKILPSGKNPVPIPTFKTRTLKGDQSTERRGQIVSAEYRSFRMFFQE